VRRLWRPVVESLVPYDAGKPLETLMAELGLTELVRLSANENSLGPSPRVVEAIQREASRVHLYPDGGSLAVRDALARRFGISPAQIVLGNGADELISLVARAAFDPGDEAVVPTPSFEPYSTSVVLAGGRMIPSPLRGYDTDLDDVLRRVTPRTKAVILCSPHNPAATIIPRAALVRFFDALGADSPLVVLDEAYCDFADDPDYPDGIEMLARYPRLLVLRTFSKVAALAGLRVGYAVGSLEAADRINRVREPYNVNRLGQVAALAALEDVEHWERTKRTVREERAFLSRELAKRGLTFPPSQANFLLVKVDDPADLRGRLLKAGLAVRDGAGVGFPGHLRITIGAREANERLLRVVDGA
jgi:histidinol-phosphate aminotransferase